MIFSTKTFSLCVVWLMIATLANGQENALSLPEETPRVIISTDLGGSDEDDIQSLIHYLTYADRFETEGIISSPPGAGRSRDIHKILDAYEKDWRWMRAHSDFPHARDLRPLIKQGAVAPALERGYTAPTQGSEWIIQCARKDDIRPLWVLVWGSITDVAQALHDAPDIATKLRVHFIGSWNLQHDQHAFSYIDTHHQSELFMIHSDTTFRGWHRGGDQSHDLGNETFVAQHIAGHGALGQLFASCHAGGVASSSIKMGDTPTVAYLLRGAANDPTQPHWGGQFVKMKGRPSWFIDDPAPSAHQPPHAGARTVNRWRTDYLRDWQKRMDWCLAIHRKGWSTFKSRNDDWFESEEARIIAGHAVSHQNHSGGWEKNLGTFLFTYHGDRRLLNTTFDNDATVDEIRFLAAMTKHTGDLTFRESFLRGIKCVLDAQYRNSGGWPQEFPAMISYGEHITYNDNAMANILELLHDISRKIEPFDTIVDEATRIKCDNALENGIRCLLRTQVIQQGKPAAWCAQHDRSSLLPSAARAYEHPTLSGQESSKILQFLMKITRPTPDVTAAVHAGAEWFSKNKILGISIQRTEDQDVFLTSDAGAPPIWARFYELGSNRPSFSDHDGVIRYRLADISKKRRINYSWHSTSGLNLLTKYASWAKTFPVKPDRLETFDGVERRLRKHRPTTQNREIAVRDYASVANISVASRIDYAATSDLPPAQCRIILCPGGDYRYLRMRKAHAHAEELSKLGLDVTILKYRTPLSLEGKWDPSADPIAGTIAGPVADLFELMRQLREESPDAKLGVIGSEAGGHLAMLAAIHHDTIAQRIRPDFVAAANSPVGALRPDWQEALTGPTETHDLALSDFYSIELHANESSCPIALSFSRERFQAEGQRLALELQQRGAAISLVTGDHGNDLPSAFIKAALELSH